MSESREYRFYSSVAMRCPPIDRIRAKAALIRHTNLACECEGCVKLTSYLGWLTNDASEAELKSWFVLTLNQAARLLECVEQPHSDYMLEYASRLCREFGSIILHVAAPADLMHDLEQSHALTRDRIQWARLRLCVIREFNLRGVLCQSHIDRALTLLSTQHFADEFNVIEFDANLHKKVSQTVAELIRQLSSK